LQLLKKYVDRKEEVRTNTALMERKMVDFSNEMLVMQKVAK
jgi:hypothetical protein